MLYTIYLINYNLYIIGVKKQLIKYFLFVVKCKKIISQRCAFVTLICFLFLKKKSNYIYQSYIMRMCACKVCKINDTRRDALN